MDDLEKEEEISEVNEEYSLKNSSKHIYRAFFFSFLRTYGFIPLSIISSWVVSRNMTDGKWAWDLFIFVNVFITAPKIILGFFPPSINSVILFKIPEYIVSDRKDTARGLIRYSLHLKILLSLITIIVFVGIGLGYIAQGTEEARLKGLGIIIFSPSIFFLQLSWIMDSFLNSIKKFHVLFQILLLEVLFTITGYIILFYVFKPENYGTRYIWMLIINLLKKIPSIFLYSFHYLRFFKNTSISKFSWNKIKDSAKFGVYYTGGTSIKSGIDQIYNFMLEESNINGLLVEYSMAGTLTGQTLTAFQFPLSSVLTPLYETGKHDQMEKLFNKTIQFSNLIMSFFIGILYVLTPAYVIFVFGPDFLDTSLIIRDYVLFAYFQKLMSINVSYLGILKKQKEMLKLYAIGYFITASLSILAFVLIGFHAFLIAQVLGNAIHSLLFSIQVNKYLEEKRNLFKNYEIFIALFICIIIIRILEKTLFNIIPFDNWGINFYYFFLNVTGWDWDLILYSSHLFSGIFSAILFLIFFITYMKVFKVISKRDVDNILDMQLKIPFKKFIGKFLNFIANG